MALFIDWRQQVASECRYHDTQTKLGRKEGQRAGSLQQNLLPEVLERGRGEMMDMWTVLNTLRHHGLTVSKCEGGGFDCGLECTVGVDVD